MGPINPVQVSQDVTVVTRLAELLKNPEALTDLKKLADDAQEAIEKASAEQRMAKTMMAEAETALREAQQLKADATADREQAMTVKRAVAEGSSALKRSVAEFEVARTQHAAKVAAEEKAAQTRERLLNERETALSERERAVAERDKALSAREEALEASYAELNRIVSGKKGE